MRKESKRQKSHEKKLQRRAKIRMKHLKRARTERELAEYAHWAKFHSDGEAVPAEHMGIDTGEEKEYNTPIQQKVSTGYDPATTPIDVGTTRMKLDGVPDVQNAGQLSEDQLRKELGLG